MKKVFIVIFACILGIALSACESPPSGNDSSEGTVSNSSKPAENSLPSEASNTDEDNKTFSEDFDGVTLTVTLDKSVYSLDSIINVTILVKNNTDTTIGLFSPVLPMNGEEASFLEINVRITKDKRDYLFDVSNLNRGMEDAVSLLKIEPGKEFVQKMQFETYYGYGESSRTIATKGVYTGTATIKLLSDPHDTNSAQTPCSVNFELEIK